eukprot:g36007.t1
MLSRLSNPPAVALGLPLDLSSPYKTRCCIFQSNSRQQSVRCKTFVSRSFHQTLSKDCVGLLYLLGEFFVNVERNRFSSRPNFAIRSQKTLKFLLLCKGFFQCSINLSFLAFS